jgi:hypothetical protein
MSRATLVAGAAAVLALVSAWHSGRHMWHRLTADYRVYSAYSPTERRRAPLTNIQIPGDVFDWYAQFLVRGDRAYYQVEQSGLGSFLDLPTAFGYAGRFYLLPAVETADPKRATIVLTYHDDPGLLGLRYVTQQRAGLQPILASRVSTP